MEERSGKKSTSSFLLAMAIDFNGYTVPRVIENTYVMCQARFDNISVAGNPGTFVIDTMHRNIRFEFVSEKSRYVTEQFSNLNVESAAALLKTHGITKLSSIIYATIAMGVTVDDLLINRPHVELADHSAAQTPAPANTAKRPRPNPVRTGAHHFPALQQPEATVVSQPKPAVLQTNESKN